jgi:hypothetical protein
MANLPWARVVTASSVGVAAATLILILVVSPPGFGAFSIGNLLLDIAVVVLVMQ